MLLLNPFLRRTASRSAMPGRARSGSRDRMTVEALEIRNLLSAAWPGLLDPQADAEPNDTLDAAQDVGNVGDGAVAEIVGSIGTPSPIVAPSLRDGESESRSDSATVSDSSTDVDWFSFTLVSAGRVQLTALPGAGGATSPVVLTLYGDQLAEFDPAVPLQHLMLGRQEGNANGSARPVDLQLEAGTYFVAVSGAGNRFFHPFLADSGVPGEAADYGVRIAVTSGQVPAGSLDQFAPAVERRSDDTTATASDLGNLPAIERLQVTGTIGDDSFYDLASEDPFAMNPAADVDLYRFSINGDGTFGLIAESFAGRIGSTLDPALTLFRADDSGTLQLVATNNNSQNPMESTNGQFPLAADAVLFAGLSAGEYFLAVSSSGNDAEFGPDGIFDPQLAHSGLNGGTVGNYVLDLSVYADSIAPQLVEQFFNVPGVAEVVRLQPPNSDEFGYDAILLHAPTHLSLRFSEPVNVQQLANSAFSSVGQNSVRAVFIEGSDGTRYFPRLQSYDAATNTARFLMLDGLLNGEFALHVSGELGLTDLAGNPLVGNDASGDFVTRFAVADAAPVADRALRANVAGNDSFATAQDLGVLFPHELQANVAPSLGDGESESRSGSATGPVTLVRDSATNAAQPADSDDFIRFELLQTQSYFFSLSNFGEGTPPAIEVLNSDGQVEPLQLLPGGKGLLGLLRAGSYVLHLGSWDTASAGNVTYHVEIELGGLSENPTPLTSGAAPAVGIRLAGHGPAPVFVHVAPSLRDGGFESRSDSATAPIPSGLLVGLNAPALGGQGLTTPAYAPDTAVVRLFGFTNRDQLFSLIDSMLPRAAETPEVTQAELTDDELRDLLNLNREASDETTAEPADADGANETANDKELPSDTPAATNPLETGSNTNTLAEPAPVLRTPSATRRSARPARIEIQSAKEKQPAALSAPLAFALATGLASTLRERSRREKDRSLIATQFGFAVWPEGSSLDSPGQRPGFSVSEKSKP